MKKSILTQGERITGKVELWGVELSAIDCSSRTAFAVIAYNYISP